MFKDVTNFFMKNKIFLIICIIGLLFGLASPLPIWPGPVIYRHLTPAIISAILVIAACSGTIKQGSKIIGIISMIYGVLATIGGIFLSAILSMFGLLGSTGAGPYAQLIMFGTILAIVVGIISIILGYKTFRASK